MILRATQAVCEDVLWFQWPHALGHLAYFWFIFDFLAVIIFPPFAFKTVPVQTMDDTATIVHWLGGEGSTLSLTYFPWKRPRGGDGKYQEAF